MRARNMTCLTACACSSSLCSPTGNGAEFKSVLCVSEPRKDHRKSLTLSISFCELYRTQYPLNYILFGTHRGNYTAINRDDKFSLLLSGEAAKQNVLLEGVRRAGMLLWLSALVYSTSERYSA